MLGLVLVLDLTGGGSIDPVGVLWGLGAAVGLAAYFVLPRAVDDELPSVAMASGGMAIGAVVLLALGAVGALPLQATFGDVAFAGQRDELAGAGRRAVAGRRRRSPTSPASARPGSSGARLSSFVGLTEVLFAVLIAWLFLGELPTPVQLLGGASSSPAWRWSASTSCGRHRPGACPMLVGQNHLWLGRRNKTEVPRLLGTKSSGQAERTHVGT